MKSKGRGNAEWHMRMYHSLVKHFGELNWWPGETPFEVCVGAILTQNTAWSNVEKAIAKLKAEDLLDPLRMDRIPLEELAQHIKSSGYYNQKSKRLKGFATFLIDNYGGKIENMRPFATKRIRRELLELNGIGPETADSILLYALNKRVFVIDAYTKRIFSRKGIFPEDIDYENARAHFEKILPRKVRLYNEFHAQIVYLGKDYCRKSRPKCESCPIQML